MEKLLGCPREYLSLPHAEMSAKLGQQAERNRRDSFSRVVLWSSVASAIIFAAFSAWLLLELREIKEYGSFANGYYTELDSLKHLIEVEKITFSGSPHFWEDGTEYIPEPEDGIKRPQNVGTPSRPIDHEWALYHWGRFFLLSEDEARDAWGPGYQEYWSPKQGGYVAALEVMHQLHCLDHIRKAFYPGVYSPDSAVHGAKHRDHCLDHLRQNILCQADLTPIPSRYYIGIDQNYIDSDRPHTCRNFGKIREWVSDRYNGSHQVPPVVSDKWEMENREGQKTL